MTAFDDIAKETLDPAIKDMYGTAAVLEMSGATLDVTASASDGERSGRDAAAQRDERTHTFTLYGNFASRPLRGDVLTFSSGETWRLERVTDYRPGRLAIAEFMQDCRRVKSSNWSDRA